MQIADGLLGRVDEAPVIGPGIAGYVAEEQVAQLGVLHIARTLVHKAEALLYQCGFPHERGAVCIVQHDIEGGIGGLVVELGNLIAEGCLLALLLCRRRVEVGDVVQRVFLRTDGRYGGIWIGYLYHDVYDVVERQAKSYGVQHRAFAPYAVRYLYVSPVCLRLAGVRHGQFLKMLAFVGQRKDGNVLLPYFHASAFTDGHRVDALLRGIVFRCLVREVDVVVDGVVQFRIIHLAYLKLLDGRQTVLKVHQKGFHFCQPLLIFLIRLLERVVQLSHQRGARCAFAYLTVSAAVRERHIQVGVAVQYLLAVEMTVVLRYQGIGRVFCMMVSPRIVEILLMDDRACRKHLQKSLQPLVDVLRLAFRQGEHFGQKQPVADGDVTVPVDDGVLRDGLDRQDTFHIHGFVLHLYLCLPDIQQSNQQAQRTD